MAQALINGILLGGLYAIVGVGMSIIFGIVKLTNLAHGDFVILGAYLSLAVSTATGLHPFASFAIVLPVMFGLGFAIQRTMVNRLLTRGDEPPLLVMFGLSIIIQNLLLQFFSADAQHLRSTYDIGSIKIGDTGAIIPLMFLIDCIIGVAIILALNMFMKKTYVGNAIRAVSDDNTAARIMGVNVPLVYGVAMGVAMVTAALAGVLVGMTYTIYPTSGSQYLIISFGVVVIGGMGSIKGTLVAGLIFGLAQLLGSYFLGTSLQLLAGYVIILVMLAVKPRGLFAK
ncbi:MAG: branched-chain amino acid ABC transporter permease [Clostridiales Family XIII bacterium]|jgi:branched-chain amino acid transport system permease protein|nr:branched-chain amino acid ABC transporter permease [Clostridiales Family XIII bacterium]